MPTDSDRPTGHADAAYEQIKSAIVGGALAPGARISEQELATRLGVSRTPVHQAVVQLQSEEWLEVSSRRGLTISPLVAAEIREIYEVLIGLEGIAATVLAGRDTEDASHAALAAANDECNRALARGDLALWAEADNRFHRLLIESSGNRRLVRVAGVLEDHAHRARLLTVRLRPWPSTSNEDHERILGAIKAGQRAEARTALEDHRRRGIETLSPIIDALTTGRGFTFVPLGS